MKRDSVTEIKRLETQHPVLMVPYIYSLSVMVYTNGNAPMEDIGAIVQKALAEKLPAGTGVGPVSCAQHGIYTREQG